MLQNMCKCCQCALIGLILLIVAFFTSVVNAADLILRVDGLEGSPTTAQPPPDGSDWGEEAYLYLQDAIQHAEDWWDLTGHENDEIEIWVRGDDDEDGVIYYPDDGAGLTAEDEKLSFELQSQLAILGGFEGDEDDVTQRQPSIYKSVLSGNISASGQDSYHVVYAGPSTVLTALLDGVTVTGGSATGTIFDQYHGGGIFIDGGRPKIRGCTITGNTASFSGGGIECLGTDDPPEIRNCKITGNSATQTGQGRGGGVSTSRSVTLINCILYDNFAAKWGAGLNVEVALSEFESVEVDVDVVNCQFVDNEVPKYGGGIYFSANGTFDVHNCVFNHNRGTDEVSDGGAISALGPTMTLGNCTFYDNTQDQGAGGGVATYPPLDGSVTNCLFYNNVAHLSAPDIMPNLVTITYCASEQTISGTGNISLASQSPPFGDPNGLDDIAGTLDDNFRLQENSPCRNEGLNSAAHADTENVDEDSDLTEKLDLDKLPRTLNTTVDQGAYEHHSSAEETCCADVNGSDCVNIDDLLAVINGWGRPGNADIAGGAGCSGNGTVDIDDLLAVITGWGYGSDPASCTCPSGFESSMPQSVEDCMDDASEYYEAYTPEWTAFVNDCVSALCRAQVIECD